MSATDDGWYQAKLAELAAWIRAKRPSERKIAKRAECGRERARRLRARALRGEDLQQQVKESTDADGERTIVATGHRIRTLTDLLTAADVDLDEWAVTRWSPNAWEQHSQKDGLVTLHQVKAHLERRALPVRPAQAITLPPVQPPRPAPDRAGKLVLCIPDTQHGVRWRDNRYRSMVTTHDPAAIDVAIQIAADLQPDRIVLGGDHLDAAAIGRYRKDQSVRQTLQPTIDLCGFDFARLRAAAPHADMDLLPSNHDQRLDDHLTDCAPEIAGLRPAGGGRPVVSLETLLRLDELRIRTHGAYGGPDEQLWIHEDVDPVALRHAGKLRHDGLSSAASNLAEATTHFVCFHEHRAWMAARTIYDHRGAREITAMNPGALVRRGGVVPGVTPRENWQQAVGLVWLYPDGVWMELIRIVNGVARYGHRVWYGDPSLEAVAEATGWEHLCAA